MFAHQTSAAHQSRSSLGKIMTIVDRIGLSVLYAMVVAVLPLTAVGVFTRTF